MRKSSSHLSAEDRIRDFRLASVTFVKELPECSVSADEEWVSVLVDESKCTVMEVLGKLQKTHKIRDMQLQEISTEDVIKKIYEEGVQ